MKQPFFPCPSQSEAEHALCRTLCGCVAGGDDDPYQLSFRGLDNSVYYMLNLDEYQQLLNYSGCGNTVSGNHPIVKDLIIAACRRSASNPALTIAFENHAPVKQKLHAAMLRW